MADPLQKRMPGLVFLHLAVVALVSLVAGMFPRPTAWAQAADVCPSGLVWREACPGDHLCVTPAERTKVRAGDKRGCPGCPGGQAPQGGICVQPSTPATTSGAPMASAAAIADPFLGVTGQRSFLIIAPDEFMAALAPLVDHKNATGMPTLAVSIGQLTARFPGADDPEKIKRGIQFAHEHLATRYVMLVGDAHWFPVRFIFFKNFSRSYPNHPNERNLPIDGLYARATSIMPTSIIIGSSDLPKSRFFPALSIIGTPTAMGATMKQIGARHRDQTGITQTRIASTVTRMLQLLARLHTAQPTSSLM